MNPPYRARDRPLPVDTPWQKFTYIMKGNASNEKVYQLWLDMLCLYLHLGILIWRLQLIV